MPKRNRETKITGGPQGEDAFIIVRFPTIAALATYRIGVTIDPNNLLKQERLALTFLSGHVLDWNWVDDDDDPLPNPHNKPEIFDLLTKYEVAFIINILSGKILPSTDVKEET